MSKLDLNMGYFIILIQEEYQHIYAFVTPWEKYTYTRLPFGDAEASDVFQRYMSDLLGDLNYVLVYLDGILIMSKTTDKHLEHVKKVLQRLKKNNLTVNGKKSQLFQMQLEYLGFVVSVEGIRLCQDKVEAIQKIKTSVNVRETRMMVGMMNYLCRHIPKLSEVLTPITALTSKKKEF